MQLPQDSQAVLQRDVQAGDLQASQLTLGFTSTHGSEARWQQPAVRGLQVAEQQDDQGHQHPPQPAGLHRQDVG